MKMRGGVEVLFLTSALHGDKRPVSRPYCFSPGERAPGNHCVGDWVWTLWRREKSLTLARSRTLPFQPVAYRYTKLSGSRPKDSR
jgi:hypothetical protein